MEQTVYIIVSRKRSNDWSYVDPQEIKLKITTIEMMAKLTAKLAAAFQHSDDINEKCIFEFSIKKITF